jgi:hypothetical protein
VTWRDSDVNLPDAIRARRVENDGTFEGAGFTISKGDTTRISPALYYHDAGSAGTYMVVWEDNRENGQWGYGQVFGQRVNDDASVEGEAHGISKWTDQSDSALAYNPTDDEYLLVWRDRRGPDYEYGDSV